jgi:hypothetical protein
MVDTTCKSSAFPRVEEEARKAHGIQISVMPLDKITVRIILPDTEDRPRFSECVEAIGRPKLPIHPSLEGGFRSHTPSVF